MPAAMRRLGLSASRICGAQRLFRRSSRGPTVLFYHGVEEDIADPEVQGLHFPVSLFERQISFVRREREVVSIGDLWESIENRKPLDARCVVLTFDDGYENNLRIVAPLLKAWNLPFTIFVSTKHISERRRFPMYYVRAAMLYTEKRNVHFRSVQQSFDLTSRERRLGAVRAITDAVKRVPLKTVDQIVTECIAQIMPDRWAELDERFKSDEPMTWGEVVRTTAMGATIGSHCHDHCILHSNQSEAEGLWQVRKSKAEIESNIGECGYIAYPNGTADDVSGSAYAAVQSEQFRMAFSTILGEITHEVDRFLAPRIFAVPDYEEFCYLLNRSSEQNEYYRTARLRSGLAGEPAGVGSN
jgi:peptidoglycan/xylan/chitin deacetylase (PgdA/CDA1 family)